MKNLSAKKSLGQNFLTSKKAIRQMIEAGNVQKNDLIIEVGPGKGILTKALLETGAKVLAFELDKRMVDFLNKELSFYIKNKQLEIIHDDILDINIKSIISKRKQKYKLIANIPYYITNAIIRKFLETTTQPTDMVLLVQREVAERIVVRDGKQSILSLSIAVFGNANYVAKVDKKYFSPMPKVNSAIIHISHISRDKLNNKKDEDMFFEIIHTAFAHKRKKCIKNLQKIIDKDILIHIFSNLGINKDVRAEELSIDTWLHIVDELKKNKKLL